MTGDTGCGFGHLHLTEHEGKKCPECGIFDFATVTVEGHPEDNVYFKRCVYCGKITSAGTMSAK